MKRSCRLIVGFAGALFICVGVQASETDDQKVSRPSAASRVDASVKILSGVRVLWSASPSERIRASTGQEVSMSRSKVLIRDDSGMMRGTVEYVDFH